MNTEIMLDNLLKMTIYNPIFAFVTIGIVWFLPGIIIRRIAKRKYLTSQKEKQEEAIAKLYPKDKK